MSEDQKKILEGKLWDIANLLRGKISADDYRDYILGFIFYKYLSEKQYLYANGLLVGEDITDYKEVTDIETLEAIKEESLLKLGYFLEPKELFSELAKKGNADTESESNYIIEDLQAVMNHIEQSTMGTESEEDFNALFEDLDLTSTKIGRTVGARNEVIVKILSHLDKIDFKLEDIESDVLGDAYEFLIAKFAAGAGKSAGEFYTPQQVSKILAKIVTTGKTKLKSVYDPTCGSGSLLLRVAREVDDVSEFYGQELNRTTYNLARMNMILHDVHFREFDIQQEDTLENPQHKDKRFEAVVANPPFSAHWKGNKNPLNSTDERFSQYGRLAPNTKADYAFVTHMVHQLADNGTMATVLPHGVLFRGAAEGVIRKYLIKELNYLDAVIGLPANIFYGTGIPTCILVFKKCREVDDNIVFIDASGDDHFTKNGNQNELRDEDVENIINTYRRRKTKEKYSYVATLEEIEQNDYNLNIPRYVETFVGEAQVDLNIVSNLLIEIEQLFEPNENLLQDYCQELEIPFPNGNNLSLLYAYRKGVLQKIFSQTIRFKDKKGNDFSDWEEKTLGEVGEIVSGLTYSPKDINEDGVLVLRSSNVQDRRLKFDDSVFVRSNSFNPVKENDILICVRNGSKRLIGKNVIINKETEGVAFGAFMSVYRSNYNSFLYNWFDTDDYKREVNKNLGATINSINGSDLKKFKVPFPSLEEQQKIATFLNSIDKKIDKLGREIDNTLNIEQGLLQKMFV